MTDAKTITTGAATKTDAAGLNVDMIFATAQVNNDAPFASGCGRSPTHASALTAESRNEEKTGTAADKTLKICSPKRRSTNFSIGSAPDLA